ncbi:MAG: alpha/beta hydrolase [Bacilli bacterium]|nr:alpha/beta hydrolase [Bacilli bacterium]
MFHYRNIKINYFFINNNSFKTLVFLHGWGQNIEMMQPIAKPFYEAYNVLIIDLPGFGKSNEPKEVWSLQDYAEMIHALICSLELNDVSLIGHSFGGKISIIYASIYNVSQLILIASPYKVAKKKISFKVKVLKVMAKVPLFRNWALKTKQKMGSVDYRNATPKMRDILVKHVNTDTTENLKKIKAPTIILWGTNDSAVGIENAYEIESFIKDAAVIPFIGRTHYVYLEELNRTVEIIKSFIR